MLVKSYYFKKETFTCFKRIKFGNTNRAAIDSRVRLK